MHEEVRADKERKRAYLSTLSARFNPDVLMGASFLKGNEYFHTNKKASEEADDGSGVDKNSAKSEPVGLSAGAGTDGENEEDDFIDLMKKTHHGRYWAEDNIAIKCHNCHQFGHMAKECPNETKKPACILCGKDTHDSYECTEKMCFKCNQVGHEARNCPMKNIITC